MLLSGFHLTGPDKAVAMSAQVAQTGFWAQNYFNSRSYYSLMQPFRRQQLVSNSAEVQVAEPSPAHATPPCFKEDAAPPSRTSAAVEVLQHPGNLGQYFVLWATTR